MILISKKNKKNKKEYREKKTERIIEFPSSSFVKMKILAQSPLP